MLDEIRISSSEPYLTISDIEYDPCDASPYFCHDYSYDSTSNYLLPYIGMFSELEIICILSFLLILSAAFVVTRRLK